MVVNPDLSARSLQVQLPWVLPGAQPVAGGSVLTGAQTIAGLEAAVVTAGPPAGTLSVSPEHLENDLVRVELAAHRFADLSEPGFGVALLNDGRYGHHALGPELGISLLRSPIWPDPLADEGEQEIVYALLPHAADGSVLAAAEDLNRPLLVRPVSAAAAPVRPLTVTGPAELGALKPLEDGGGLVLRVYEPFGDRGRVAVTPPPGWALDTELDLLERPAGAPQTELGPFAVRSWALRPTSRPSP